MKKLIFEQIGCACTRFRLEYDKGLIFEINSYQGKTWMVDSGGTKKSTNQSFKLTRKNHNLTFKNALEAVQEYFMLTYPNNNYQVVVGADSYGEHQMVKDFCKKEGVPFKDAAGVLFIDAVNNLPMPKLNLKDIKIGNSILPIVAAVRPYDKKCDCHKEKHNFTSHALYCPMHPSKRGK